ARDNLRTGQFDLWDSKKVSSDETTQIIYRGKPLTSEQDCWWQARVWNAFGEASPWSEPARWTMGLLNKSAWAAQWIGYDAMSDKERADEANQPDITLDHCKWIWTDETKTNP